jgi:membrane-associated phospholipid phosphatase
MFARPLTRSWYNTLASTVVGTLLIIIVLTITVPERIEDASSLLLRTLAVLLAAGAILYGTPRLKKPLRVTVRAGAIIALISFLFSAVSGLQHMLIPGWMDAELITFETRFTGEELSHILERITNPVLTEWLMASYVIYIPLMPFTAWVVYRYGGETQVYAFLFSILAVNLLCDIGFIVYPIASQLFFDPDQYTMPLTGGIFTDMAEWIRANEHYPGGSFPSPHNAAGTVMFIFLWRTHRRWAAVMTPFLLSIPMATVYGRFHYVSDAIVGIALSLTVLHLVLQARPVSIRFDIHRLARKLFPKLQLERSSFRG